MTLNLRVTLPALAGLLAAAGPASAGWDNVFQVCCHDCRPRASYYAPAAPCPQPCPQPEARVSYVQRCYYQPVTEYKRESYYVPVKENVTSHYWEPVTSYRYTSYYDPCSGCCQDVAVPTTSYRLRQQCNSVTRWVEQSRCVPVTSYRQVTMYQPVVSYYYPPTTSYSIPALPSAPCPPGSATAPVGPPRVDELRQNPPTVMPGGSTDSTTIPPPNVPTGPGGVSQPRVMPSKPSPSTSGSFARTASRGTGSVRGEVVLNDRQTPRPGAKVVFVSAAKTDDRRYATANEFGEFDAKLPAGDWYIYLGQGNGSAVRHSKISVGDFDARDVTLVSR